MLFLRTLLLTGITPQLCAEKGLCESEFAEKVWERLNMPGTVNIGLENDSRNR